MFPSGFSTLRKEKEVDQETREYILFPLTRKETFLELANVYGEFMDDVIEALRTGTNRESTLKDALGIKPRLLAELTERAELEYEKYLTQRILYRMDGHSALKAAQARAIDESIILEAALGL
jgi:hypothetical protein